MGLIRKTVSIGTLGIVPFRSKKEQLRRAEKAYREAEAELAGEQAARAEVRQARSPRPRSGPARPSCSPSSRPRRPTSPRSKRKDAPPRGRGASAIEAIEDLVGLGHPGRWRSGPRS